MATITTTVQKTQYTKAVVRARAGYCSIEINGKRVDGMTGPDGSLQWFISEYSKLLDEYETLGRSKSIKKLIKNCYLDHKKRLNEIHRKGIYM